MIVCSGHCPLFSPAWDALELILEVGVCSGHCPLFSPAWDALEPTLEVGVICPFVAIDPTD